MQSPHLSRIGQAALVAVLCISGPARAQENPAVEAAPVASTDTAPFFTENAAAMDKMMLDMNVRPTGDINVDFTAMMIPHHQGAIDMAVAYLRYGSNEQLRRLAQEIIVEQQQEIAAMRLALGQQLPPSAPAPTQPGVTPLAFPAPIPPTHVHPALQMLTK